MLTTETRIIVRYAEVDRMGIAHHANYPVWFEAGRTDFFRRLGLSYAEIENSGALLPLIKLECNFVSPLRYENEILLKTRLAEFTRVKVTFDYKINYQGKTATTGRTVHAWTNWQLKPVNLAKENPKLYQLLEQSSGAPSK
jgi:acyl-CoA thioester hydrolase